MIHSVIKCIVIFIMIIRECLNIDDSKNVLMILEQHLDENVVKVGRQQLNRWIEDYQ